MPVTENSMFFEGGAYYGQEQFARFLKDIGGHNGVVHGIGDELQVVANDPANMAVQVKSGRSWVNGYIHEILEDPVQLVIDEADPSNDRIDRVVLHLNTTNPRGIAVLVLKGTAGSGQPPALTQTATVWEEPLYQVRVPARTLTISQEYITDEREYMLYTRANMPKTSSEDFGVLKVGSGLEVADGVVSTAAIEKVTINHISLTNNVVSNCGFSVGRIDAVTNSISWSGVQSTSWQNLGTLTVTPSFYNYLPFVYNIDELLEEIYINVSVSVGFSVYHPQSKIGYAWGYCRALNPDGSENASAGVELTYTGGGGAATMSMNIPVSKTPISYMIQAYGTNEGGHTVSVSAGSRESSSHSATVYYSPEVK